MKRAYAVIGANWGDEGKGLAVDALADKLGRASGARVIVVRSNGGAQAGHGVHCPERDIHNVFHHVGSGTFAGADTHLSRFFVAQPMLFPAEMHRLMAIDTLPRVSMDPRALVTTPWDVGLNHLVEVARGAARHGSCGLGFGETIERSERGYAVTFGDLRDDPENGRALAARLRRIRDEWLPLRMAELGLTPDTDQTLHDQLMLDETAISFIRDCTFMRRNIRPVEDGALPSDAIILFEGAQGLQLDMDFGAMPHVTRSNTGLLNMGSLALDMGITEILACYVTRAYATRHGAGPLPFEGEYPADALHIIDRTNVTNAWQGSIRNAPLSLPDLRQAIRHDLTTTSLKFPDLSLIPMLAVTCLDQSTTGIIHARGQAGEDLRISVVDYPGIVAAGVGLPLGFHSHGPTRLTVSWEAGI